MDELIDQVKQELATAMIADELKLIQLYSSILIVLLNYKENNVKQD